MNYNEALKAINPMAALKSLKIKGKKRESYIYFPCPECNEAAVIKTYGEKKNLWLCTKCKVCGHIITLTMKMGFLKDEQIDSHYQCFRRLGIFPRHHSSRTKSCLCWEHSKLLSCF